jgi:glyoxylase-like metal-dependent hydrolase (beta-lactamase superfamily II)
MGKLSGYLPHRWPTWLKPHLVDYQPQVGVFNESFTLTKAGGVHIVPTPGHTEGHQSVILQDYMNAFFFAGDTSYSEKNLYDQVVDGVSLNTHSAKETIERINSYVATNQAIYLPSHDPDSAKRLAEVSQSMLVFAR